MRSSVPCEDWDGVEKKAIEGLMLRVTAHRIFLESYLARKTKTGNNELREMKSSKDRFSYSVMSL